MCPIRNAVSLHAMRRSFHDDDCLRNRLWLPKGRVASDSGIVAASTAEEEGSLGLGRC